MADKEQVHIKLGLSGTYWDKKPQYRVSVNGQVFAENSITADSDTVEYVEFDVEYSTDSSTLKIELMGKEFSDTVQNADKTAILKDMLLNIVSIEIDEIDLGQIPFKHSEYHPLDQDNVIRECMNLGWNGVWTLTWTNPFYIWLLETI